MTKSTLSKSNRNNEWGNPRKRPLEQGKLNGVCHSKSAPDFHFNYTGEDEDNSPKEIRQVQEDLGWRSKLINEGKGKQVEGKSSPDAFDRYLKGVKKPSKGNIASPKEPVRPLIEEKEEKEKIKEVNQFIIGEISKITGKPEEDCKEHFDNLATRCATPRILIENTLYKIEKQENLQNRKEKTVALLEEIKTGASLILGEDRICKVGSNEKAKKAEKAILEEAMYILRDISDGNAADILKRIKERAPEIFKEAQIKTIDIPEEAQKKAKDIIEDFQKNNREIIKKNRKDTANIMEQCGEKFGLQNISLHTLAILERRKNNPWFSCRIGQ